MYGNMKVRAWNGGSNLKNKNYSIINSPYHKFQYYPFFKLNNICTITLIGS